LRGKGFIQEKGFIRRGGVLIYARRKGSKRVRKPP
jgi:hypothetical protein